MILDHLTISVTDFARAKAFYERALKPLGIRDPDGYNVEAVCHTPA